jgi:hypothetical protein
MSLIVGQTIKKQASQKERKKKEQARWMRKKGKG